MKIDTPEIVSLSAFENYYTEKGWIKYYRPYNASNGVKAANWARNTYVNSNDTYKINTNLSSTHETYCSKIVWQAYRYGVGTDAVFYPFQTGVIAPYALFYEIKDTTLIGQLN